MLATAFGGKLRSLSSPYSRYLTSNAFWENFPTLTSLCVHSLWWGIVLPPIHHPMNELVLDMQRGYSPSLFNSLIRRFISAAYQYPQASSPAVMSASRKVVLVGLKWTEDCKVMKEIMGWNVEWEKLAPHVEDELGETLAAARARFLKNNRHW
jgi:hypothetical protein